MSRYFAGLHNDLKNVFHDALCEYIRNSGTPINRTRNPVSSVSGDMPSWKKRIRSFVEVGKSIFIPNICCTESIITENKIRIENHEIMFAMEFPRKLCHPLDIVFESVLRSESSGPKYEIVNSIRKIVQAMTNASPISKENGTL